MPARPSAVVLEPERAPDVVDTLCEAFRDYPVMRYVLGAEGAYERRLRVLVDFFVTARVLRGETLLGIQAAGRLEAAALLSGGGTASSPAALADVRETVWSELGGAARSRYEDFGRTCAAFEVDVPHLHLNMIGVRRALRGTGLGRRLVDAVHVLSANHPTSCGVTLTTEDEANVALYRHLGYDLVGEADVAPELHTWGFYRADPPRSVGAGASPLDGVA